jgi:hypothetical protein
MLVGVSLAVYDAVGQQLLAEYSKMYLRPYPVIISSNKLMGYMTTTQNNSDPSILVAEYYSTTCTDNCTGQGVCRDQVCICDPGWTGASCSERT